MTRPTLQATSNPSIRRLLAAAFVTAAGVEEVAGEERLVWLVELVGWGEVVVPLVLGSARVDFLWRGLREG